MKSSGKPYSIPLGVLIVRQQGAGKRVEELWSMREMTSHMPQKQSVSAVSNTLVPQKQSEVEGLALKLNSLRRYGVMRYTVGIRCWISDHVSLRSLGTLSPIRREKILDHLPCILQ